MSSGDQAALYIRRLMFDGDLRPGTRVPQDEIAQALGVSRIPVREALIALEREGCQVTRLSVRPDGLLDLAELERAAVVARAARRRRSWPMSP